MLYGTLVGNCMLLRTIRAIYAETGFSYTLAQSNSNHPLGGSQNLRVGRNIDVKGRQAHGKRWY